MAANDRCAVVIPNVPPIHPDCERSLRELDRRGYVLIKAHGPSPLDMVRSQLASDLLTEGFLETFWINGNIGFSANDVDLIRSHQLPITGALHPRPGMQALAAKPIPGTTSIALGAGGGLMEFQYVSAGFLHVRREVYQTIQSKLALPVCSVNSGRPLVPYFLPLVIPAGNDHVYLADDYAFCERARQAGFKVMVDTRVRLWHLGDGRSSWEEAAQSRPRHEAFIFQLHEESQG
jgi:hypothetical protein